VIGVLVSGEGSNLQALLDAGFPVVAVVSSKPGVPALERASEAGVETRVFAIADAPTRETRDAAMAAWLVERGVELVVTAGFMELLRAPFLGCFPGRIVNVHPALLPEFPGRRPIERALAAGVRQTGVTVHLVDEGVDTGPILRQEAVPIAKGDTVETLRQRIQTVEHRLLPQAVLALLAERVPA